MAKKRRHKHPKNDFVDLTPEKTKDAAAARAAAEIDAAADRQWFLDHPGEMIRERVCSPREMRATGCLPGTLVRISRLPGGAQRREICHGQMG